MNVPVVINCRDRVTPLRLLVDWLERAEVERIVLVDNASTYPPLVEYLERSPHEVVRLAENLGPRAPWTSGVVGGLRSKWYVVTDPDVVPSEECPLDALAFMVDLLRRRWGYSKVGLGLRSDDLPAHYRFADEVRILESEFYAAERRLEEHVWRSPVDTTFALYRASRPFTIDHALRLGQPYMARHWPWYEDSANPSEEELYYVAHADGWNNFRTDVMPDWLLEHVERISEGRLYPPTRPQPLTRLGLQALRRAWRAARSAARVAEGLVPSH